MVGFLGGQWGVWWEIYLEFELVSYLENLLGLLMGK